MSGLHTFRPNASVKTTGWSVEPDPAKTHHDVTSDDSDSTWVETLSATSELILGLGTYTLAAGERIKRMRMRVRWASDTSGLSSAVEYGFVKPDKPSYTSTTSNRTSTSPVTSTGAYVIPDWFKQDNQQTELDILEAWAKWKTPNDSGPRIHEIWVDVEVWERVNTPTVPEPTGTITDTDVPTVESYATGIGFGLPSSYSKQVRVFRDAVYTAGGFDPATETDVEFEVLDTGHGTPSTDSGAPDETQITDPLPNSDTYRAYVRYGKNDVAGQTLWSEWSHTEFTLDLTLPTAPTVTATPDSVLNRVQLDIDTAVLTHDTFEGASIERSVDGGTTWESIRFDESQFSANDSHTLYDYEAPRGVSLLYRARVTEGLTASGTTISSDWTTTSSLTLDNDLNWWLKDPLDPDRNMVVIAEGDALTKDHQIDVAHFRPLGSELYTAIADVARDPRFPTLTIGTVGKQEYDDLMLLLKSLRTLLLQSPMDGEDEQAYVSVDSPINERVLNTSSLWRKLVVTLIPVQKPS